MTRNVAKPKTYHQERRATVIMDEEDYQAVKALAQSKGLPFSRFAALVLKKMLKLTESAGEKTSD